MSQVQSGGGPSTAEQARGQAQEVAERAQETAAQVAGKAQVQMRDQVERRSTQVGEQMTATANVLRTSGDELSRQGQDAAAQAARGAAARAEQLGGYLRDADADRILADAEQFGRENPWAVIAVGLVAGVAAARFLKASSGRRYQAAYRVDGARSAPR